MAAWVGIKSRGARPVSPTARLPRIAPTHAPAATSIPPNPLKYLLKSVSSVVPFSGTFFNAATFVEALSFLPGQNEESTAPLLLYAWRLLTGRRPMLRARATSSFPQSFTPPVSLQSIGCSHPPALGTCHLPRVNLLVNLPLDC